MAARRSGSHEGLIIPADPVTNSQRKLIVDLAARYRLPAIYGLRAAPGEGGLMSYGSIFRTFSERRLSMLIVS
jgi:hypothetical protein